MQQLFHGLALSSCLLQSKLLTEWTCIMPLFMQTSSKVQYRQVDFWSRLLNPLIALCSNDDTTYKSWCHVSEFLLGLIKIKGKVPRRLTILWAHITFVTLSWKIRCNISNTRTNVWSWFQTTKVWGVWKHDQTLVRVFDTTSQTNTITSGENEEESLANLCKCLMMFPNLSRLWFSFVLALWIINEFENY